MTRLQCQPRKPTSSDGDLGGASPDCVRWMPTRPPTAVHDQFHVVILVVVQVKMCSCDMRRAGMPGQRSGSACTVERCDAPGRRCWRHSGTAALALGAAAAARRVPWAPKGPASVPARPATPRKSPAVGGRAPPPLLPPSPGVQPCSAAHLRHSPPTSRPPYTLSHMISLTQPQSLQ